MDPISGALHVQRRTERAMNLGPARRGTDAVASDDGEIIDGDDANRLPEVNYESGIDGLR
jgi:hypothetical protein